MTAVLTAPEPVARDHHAGRLIHAFPEGSNVALCGVLISPTERGGAHTFCRACEREAANPVWRAAR